MLAVAFPRVATSWERLAVALCVLLVVVVLYSGLRVLQCLLVSVDILSPLCLKLFHGDPIRVDVAICLILPYKVWDPAELPVVLESRPIFLDSLRLPLVLVNVWVRLAANPRRVFFQLLAGNQLLVDHLSDLFQRVIPNICKLTDWVSARYSRSPLKITHKTATSKRTLLSLLARPTDNKSKAHRLRGTGELAVRILSREDVRLRSSVPQPR